MDARRRRKGAVRRAALAVIVITFRAAAATGADETRNVRIVNNVQKSAVARAFGGAVRQMAHPECQGLLDEFSDLSGRPLRATLQESGFDAPDYLGSVLFYDAPPRLCATSVLAATTPGSRVILVCGERFVRQMAKNSRHAEATIIHEALHSLGLGENPPSSDHINERVLARCGR
jgi:hypothetical protein